MDGNPQAMTVTPPQFTERQVTAYLANQGAHCPGCGGTNFEGSSFDVDGGGCRQEVTCLECYTTWIDTYQLVGITRTE